MSLYGLQTLVARSVISDSFRTAMLNGRRAELIRDLDLDPDEATQIMAIGADSLPDFANGVFEIMETRYPRPAPVWVERLWTTGNLSPSRRN